MKSFRFSLERVLKVRQHQTMLAKHALASAQLMAAQAWATLERARLDRKQFDSELQEQRSKRMTAQSWAAADAQRERHQEHEKRLTAELHGALAEVVAKRRELEETERRERMLEKLKEQQYESFRNGELTEEQALMDEMAQRAGRDPKGVGRA